MQRYVEGTWGLWEESWQIERFVENFETAKWRVIEVAGVIAGMVSWEETPTEIWLGSIEVHPRFQGRGIGTAVIRLLAEDARAKRKPLTLRVLHVNERARALYERLGFQPLREIETHTYLRLLPE